MPDSTPQPLTPDALHDLLTAGYGRVLELEAERTAAGRRIDALLGRRADDDAVLRLVRRQRALAAEISALRAELAELEASRRPRPEA